MKMYDTFYNIYIVLTCISTNLDIEMIEKPC